jgi:hypothetical protein
MSEVEALTLFRYACSCVCFKNIEFLEYQPPPEGGQRGGTQGAVDPVFKGSNRGPIFSAQVMPVLPFKESHSLVTIGVRIHVQGR